MLIMSHIFAPTLHKYFSTKCNCCIVNVSSNDKMKHMTTTSSLFSFVSLAYWTCLLPMAFVVIFQQIFLKVEECCLIGFFNLNRGSYFWRLILLNISSLKHKLPKSDRNHLSSYQGFVYKVHDLIKQIQLLNIFKFRIRI